ncbi:MAG: hypothetical protein MN733_26315, partial [Nitrososphaera sp.]|nr:hypothetical protein [Nitrososphaera sp.]
MPTQSTATLSTKADRLLRLADRVQRSETFDMRHFFNECRTPACIAGHALVQKEEEKEIYSTYPPRFIRDSFTEAMEYLMLTFSQANTLFIPNFDCANLTERPGYPGYISATRAARVLRHFALTDAIDWTIGDETEAA